MRNLIFIEGVSGVGKSTTAARLCDELNRHGYSTSCHLEGDPNNQIDLCWFAYLTKPEFERLRKTHFQVADDLLKNARMEADYVLVQYRDKQTQLYTPEIYDYLAEREACYKPVKPIPLANFTEIFLNRWRRFMGSDFAKHDYAVFDGTFLHHPINDLIRNYGASDSDIAKHLEAILQAIAPMNPMVFYLSSESVEERLTKAFLSRGQGIPTTEQIGFWQNRKRIDGIMLDALPIPSRVVSISQDNWDWVIGRIQSFVVNK